LLSDEYFAQLHTAQDRETSDGSDTVEARLDNNEDDNIYDGDGWDDDDDNDGAVPGPTDLSHVNLSRTIHKRYTVEQLSDHLNVPDLHILIQRFLYDQLHLDRPSLVDVPLSSCPSPTGRIHLHLSAVATYYAPSDLSGIGGMRRERIRAIPSWRRGSARYDCVIVNSKPELPGMRGLDIARIFAFFSVNVNNTAYPCALAQWFSRMGNEPDADTGMWMVQPEEARAIIHLDCIVRAAHLIPAYGKDFLPPRFHFSRSLDSFLSYYVNKYADHHMFETVF
jgi:hypothetical protein